MFPASCNNELGFAVVAEVADAHGLGACTRKVWRLDALVSHDSKCRAALEFAKSVPFSNTSTARSMSSELTRSAR